MATAATSLTTAPVVKPLCQPRAIREEWDQMSVQKGWIQKVHAWMSFESAPAYGKKQNLCELVGVVLLIPCSLLLAVFFTKQPENANQCHLVLQKVAALILIVITLPLHALGACVKGVGEMLPHQAIECDDTSKTRTHPLIAQACYSMTEIFSQACAQIHFDRYYPIDGTLLGAVRHGGFIPWDDDVDLGVDVTDIDRLRRDLKPLLEARGIVWAENLYDSFKVIKLTFRDDVWERLVTEHQISYPGTEIPEELRHHAPNIIDLCACDIMSDGSWASASSAGRAMFPTDYISLEAPTERESPRQYIQFGNLQLPTFSNATIIRFLKTYYGDDCLTHGVQTHSHGSIETCWGRIPIPKFHPTYRFKITGAPAAEPSSSAG